ncbi:hypothetical protein Tco_1362390 [Tanacetum coccineum]
MQVTILPLTAWRESHASRYDRFVPKQKYLQYCSEQVCLEGSEKLSSATKGVNLIPTPRRDLLGDVKIPKVGGSGMVSPEIENEKWRRLILHWMYDAFDVSTDDREEDFFP